MKIGIAGAGLLGRLLAWRLAHAGHAVTVFDPAADAQARGAAGWTAAGMLSPWAELESADERTAARGQRSIALWAHIVAALAPPVHFRRDGSVLLAHRADIGSAQRLLALLQARGAPAQALTPPQLRALEPGVHGPLHAWLLPGEAQIDTVAAMSALAAAPGVTWRWGHTVQRIGAGVLDDARFDQVFDVRGVGAKPDLPVRGVRGEIVWLHAPGVVLNRPLRLLHPRWRVYLVPRPGDRVLVGATEIESEDRSPVSVRSLLGLLSAAHSVMPELAEARVVQMETNLRPALPDNLPRVDTQAGLTRINGLFRHGWLVAPALVEEALVDAGLVPSAGQGEGQGEGRTAADNECAIEALEPHPRPLPGREREPTVLVNGQAISLAPGTNLHALLTALGHDHVATAVNDEFVPREQRKTRLLQPGDRITCFHPIVGG